MIKMTCDCGHVGLYRTERLATFNFARHSCTAVTARRERAERRAAREASAGQARDCTHPRARHQHGTRNGYVLDRCRCYDCKVASRDYENARTRAIAYGRPSRYVDAEPVRLHLRALMDQGMGMKRIAEKAGLSHGSVSPVLYGKGKVTSEHRPPRARLLRANADALLAVTLDLAPAKTVANVGTARRIQALVAVGWSMSKIATAAGVHPSNFVPVAHGRRDVRASTAKAIAELYDAWWDQQPPTSTTPDLIAYRRSLTFAAEHGWVPPLAWDDDEIDDPTATPHTGESADAPSRGRRVHAEDVEQLHDEGLTLDGILDRLHVGRDSIYIALKRQGRLDLWNLLLDRRATYSNRSSIRRSAPSKQPNHKVREVA